VAALLGINVWTYLLWENDRAEPTVRYWPKLIGLLGYDPNPSPKSWQDRLKTKRRALGLTVKAAAQMAGVDEGTFSRWERGLARSLVQKDKFNDFLSDD
jgi:DNA-binding XRE family transcriptional regulator